MVRGVCAKPVPTAATHNRAAPKSLFIDGLRNERHTQFEGGTATYLDVISAEELLFPAELSLAEAQASQLVAFVQLYRALGGGWWLPPPSATAAAPVK